MRHLFARLRRSEKGAAIVEFALVAPVLATILFGLFDLGYNIYTKAVLQGALQDAARDASIEGSDGAAIDQLVTQTVQDVAPDATFTFERKAYDNFADVNTAEDYNDLNSDGVCNDNEPFEDANNNGVWDADRAVLGQGGARDAVLYTVTITYPRMFPIAAFIPGVDPTYTSAASTVLRNQPYENVGGAPSVENCP